MKITIEGVDYNLPASLMDITLSDRIAFDKQHGKALTDQLKKIAEMKDGVDREIEFTCYHFELACKTLSYFGNIPIDIVENTQAEEVLTMYHHLMKGFSEDVDFSAEVELQNEFHWMDETWHIAPPQLTHHSSMTFGEFLDAKQSTQNLYELGNEKWEALLMLCCVYFRKKGEPYNKELITEGGDRYELMKKLPFAHALHVGFFLASSQTMYISTSHYSGKAKESTEVFIPQGT